MRLDQEMDVYHNTKFVT